MRLKGILKNWNAERGFGVIGALQGGQQIFVHVNAFPREKRTPVEGDALSFEIETDEKGRRRAAKVQLSDANWTLFEDPHWPESKLETLTGASRFTDSRLRTAPRPEPRRSNLPWVILTMLAIVVAGWMALNKYSHVLISLGAKPSAESVQTNSVKTEPPVDTVKAAKASSKPKSERPKLERSN